VLCIDFRVFHVDDIDIDDEVPLAPASSSSTSHGNKKTTGQTDSSFNWKVILLV
jgi:hypothetical protein